MVKIIKCTTNCLHVHPEPTKFMSFIECNIQNMFVYICRLKAAQTELDTVMAQLKEKQEKLSAIEAKV